MATDKILVLDLDATIISTSSDMAAYFQIYNNPALADRLYTFELVDGGYKEVPGGGKTCFIWGILRPGVYDFLVFADTYFKEVRIWSAGQYKYVHAIVNILYSRLPDIRRPSIIKTYCDCIISEHNIFKNLSTFHHGEQGKILSLDDRSDTFRNNPYNGIKIPAYEPTMDLSSILAEELTLSQLCLWLLVPQVKNAIDVRTLNKDNIFKVSVEAYMNAHYSGVMP
jgi:hypothetical protein